MMRFIKSLIAPVLAIVASLALVMIALAMLPTRDEQFSFTQKLGIIRETTWQRVLRPRPADPPDTPSGFRDRSYRNWIQTLQSATPILLTGLAVTLAFRAGVLNIGAQGQLVVGAIAATAVGAYIAAPSVVIIPVLMLAAALAGALFAMIAAALERWRNVPVVLSTLLLNFVALEFLRYLLQGPMRARSDDGGLLDPQSRELLEAARLHEFFAVDLSQGIHLGFFIALAAAVIVGLLLRYTTFGFRLRMTGQNPEAARFAGMNVAGISFATLALSGALAGLAGASQVAGLRPYVLYPDMGTSALGFTGIAVALLGRLSPLGVVLAALFFGLLNTTFRALERSPLEIHSVTSQAVQGLLVVAMLVATSPLWGRRVGRLLGRSSVPSLNENWL